MPRTLTARLALLLTLPPLLWAGNAVVGRAVIDLIPPILFNAARWSLALLLLLPLTHALWAQRAQVRAHWRWWAATGVLGMGSYNALLYQALHTSSAVNVTLIAASLPLAMLLIGRLFFGVRAGRWQLAGALCSLAGVLVVVSHGQAARLLQVQWVQGDMLMLLATLCWAGYSWLLTRSPAAGGKAWPWANTLATQTFFGLLAALPLSLIEPQWSAVQLQPGWGLAGALLFIAIGPSVIAYRCWGLGVAQAGPALTGFFANLTPLFTALLSAALLGEAPHGYHGLAFVLIAAGISLSARQRTAAAS